MKSHMFLARWAILCSLCFSLPVDATQFFTVPWSTKTYGPDGPWQAVQITVGGDNPDLAIEEGPHAVVDLLPGGEFAGGILSTEACEPWGGDCGKGGVWDPVGDPEVEYQPSYDLPAAGIFGENNNQRIQGMNLGGQTVWNVTILSIINTTVIAPNGDKRGPELGAFSLGSPNGVTQDFFTGQSIGVVSWLFPGYLFNQSIIPSYSYGLHIGSAALNYTGSLIFGGYDKGRAIGPFTTADQSNEDQFTLLDIGIGVETGASPFTKSNFSSLLVDNQGQTGSLKVLVDPLAPYLSLPQRTCEAIAACLPVYFDKSLQYWLWNTSDPQYKTVVTSPSYLSFTFPPAPGQLQNIVIKVPFALLNLVLDTPIANSPTKYFPCQGYEPGSGDFHHLGRAFLQGAFIGRNWNAGVTWLAQAPGPGVGQAGLGAFPVNIQNTDNTLNGLFDDDKLFAQSWEPYWTPIPGSKSSVATSAATSAASSSTSSGLSKGAKVGIGVGVSAGALLGVCTVVICLLRRRKAASQTGSLSPRNTYEHSDVKFGHPEVVYPFDVETPPSGLRGTENVHAAHELSSTPLIH